MDRIDFDIARKARAEWVRKAARLRVKAQEAERKGPIGFEEDERHAGHVAQLHAGADEAETLAREWAEKARAIANAGFANE